MIDLIVTTIDGKSLRASAEHDSVETAADRLNMHGVLSLSVESTAPGMAGRKTKTIVYRHGVISLAER